MTLDGGRPQGQTRGTMLAIHSILRLYRAAQRHRSLAELRAFCKDDSEAAFVDGFSDFTSACAELARLVEAQGGLEALEGLEKMNDFNEFIYGWDD